MDIHLLLAVVITLVGVGSDSGGGGSKAVGSAGESSKQHLKNGKEPIQWHTKCDITIFAYLMLVFYSCTSLYRDKHIQVWKMTVGEYNSGVYTAFYSINMNNR